MIIFVSNISPDTTVDDLKKFAEAPLKSWIPFRTGKINKGRILKFRDMTTKLMEYHGLIYVDERHGHILLKKLNRTKLVNKYVNVREYKTRSLANDRRRTLGYGKEFGNRLSDRRRGDFLHITDNVKITAMAASLRKN